MSNSSAVFSDDPDLLLPGEFLLRFLTPLQILQICEQFLLSWNRNKQVLWTGNICRKAQEWAGQRDMRTLLMAMGPLAHESSPEHQGQRGGKKKRTTYMRGASALFAWLITTVDESVTILCPPPPDRVNPEGRTNMQLVELPILVGLIGGHPVSRIEVVHPMVTGAEDFRYQIWPHDEKRDWQKRFAKATIPRTVWKQRAKTPQVRQIEESLMRLLSKTGDEAMCLMILPQKAPITMVAPQHNQKRCEKLEAPPSGAANSRGAADTSKAADCGEPSSEGQKVQKSKKSKGKKPVSGIKEADARCCARHDATAPVSGKGKNVAIKSTIVQSEQRKLDEGAPVTPCGQGNGKKKAKGRRKSKGQTKGMQGTKSNK